MSTFSFRQHSPWMSVLSDPLSFRVQLCEYHNTDSPSFLLLLLLNLKQSCTKLTIGLSLSLTLSCLWCKNMWPIENWVTSECQKRVEENHMSCGLERFTLTKAVGLEVSITTALRPISLLLRYTFLLILSIQANLIFVVLYGFDQYFQGIVHFSFIQLHWLTSATLTICSSEKISGTLGIKPGSAWSGSKNAHQCAIWSPCLLFLGLKNVTWRWQKLDWAVEWWFPSQTYLASISDGHSCRFWCCCCCCKLSHPYSEAKLKYKHWFKTVSGLYL